jgi:hypothetical protein
VRGGGEQDKALYIKDISFKYIYIMSRDWCWTSFDTNKELSVVKENVRYICYGVERCETTGREHYQGFAIFNRTCRIPKAKQWIGGGDGVHCEPRRGTRDQARDYCRKDGKFWEWGVYDAMTKEMLFKQPIGYIKENHPEFFCRYHRGLEKLQPKGDKWRDVKVTVLWGETGVGKTKEAVNCDSWYKLDPPYNWFDGYEGETRLILDDYRTGSIPRGMLLNLLDGYRLRLETKGGHTWALWTEVYITTNYDPGYWENAVLRRCDIVTALSQYPGS